LIISFETRNLHECCCRVEAAEQRLGSVHAQALATVIAEAEAFENAQEWIDFCGLDIFIAEDDSLLVLIGSDYHARFVAAGLRFARNNEGRVVWMSVQRLKLMDISRRQ
jgi:hypothetical protein